MQKPGEDKRSRIFVNRSSLVAAGSSRAAAISPKLGKAENANNLPGDDAAPGKSSLRVEMQTKDPNIRIIWFTQSNKPLPNAKGT